MKSGRSVMEPGWSPDSTGGTVAIDKTEAGPFLLLFGSTL